jgi:hypothetical protein
MTDLASGELRARWENWLRSNYGGSDEQIARGTQAAMTAIGQRRSQSEVAAAALFAWKNGVAAADPREARAPTPPTPPAAANGARSNPGAVASRREVRGQVVGFSPRTEVHGRRYVTLWFFNVRQMDGNVVSVRMRGIRFNGALNNGDVVSFRRRRPDGDGIVHVNRVSNLTTNSIVRVTRGYSPASGLMVLLALLFVAAGVAFLTVPSSHLPPFLPGKTIDGTKPATQLAVPAFVGAVFCFVLARVMRRVAK